MKSPCYFT